MHKNKSYFFCGIGGSGMLPLANILVERGAIVAGSDRALDQGRLGAKFEWLQSLGIELFAQDGSGLVSGDQILVASAAIEDSVPDVAKANALGCARMTRAELLAELFNASPRSVAVGGTSGKSTVTGMIGWILANAGLDPTIMNGAVMKNFVADGALFASARVGQGDVFVSEVDESDGSIALFMPEVAVLNNVSLDHKSLEELRALFGDFAQKAKHVVWNADDTETVTLISSLKLDQSISFGMSKADVMASDIADLPLGSHFTLHISESLAKVHGLSLADCPVSLQVPGRHNIANALAAIAAALAIGVPLAEAARSIEGFKGLARRFDIVGEVKGITVIDDFGHNPEKVAATLDTLKAFPGRIIAFFQPHGYGPIRMMGKELAEVFATRLGANDRLILCDPVYFGGTVDKSMGSASMADAVVAAGGRAEHIPSREDCGLRIAELAQPGDRIVIMGARDDTLSAFATGILSAIRAA
ncbi:MAG: UDP-N-acetylmuramate--alanine ligase [Sphingomonadaceae bacterium]|nr:UDP-N-acetylmuramate--alanine ligase [Sphingomonadaceae bacterium]